jgi:hypothetical protein
MDPWLGASLPRRFWAIGSVLTLGAALASVASAGDALFAPQASGAPRATRCGGPGPGYFAIKGSSACVKITGYVAASDNFGSMRSYQRPLALDTRLGLAPSSGASADVRFETPEGPGHVHFSFGRGASAR